MQKKTMVMGAGGLAAAALLLMWAFSPRPLAVEVAPVVTGLFEAGIEEDARTRLHDRYSVSAPLAGRLARIALREGDTVQAGDVVARILPALPALLDERTLREHRARLAAAQAGEQRAVVRLERSRLARQQAGEDLRRSEQLAGQGFVAESRLAAERVAYEAAQRDADAAAQEVLVARADVAQARAALDTLQRPGDAAGKAFEVRSPIAGRVLKVALASEGMVALGSTLLEVGDTARLEVVAPLLSTDALQAQPGSPVRIERWGGPTVLQGRVRSVEPAAFTKVSALGVEEQRVNVLIDLTSPPAEWAALGDGYRVVARVLTRQAPDVTLVPVSALFPLPAPPAAAASPEAPGARRMAVFVVEAGRARRAEVQVQARGGTHAWVAQGVQPGSSVVVYPPTALQDGARVTVRAP